MSFNCYTHGWQHLQNPCPLCHPIESYTSSGTGEQMTTDRPRVWFLVPWSVGWQCFSTRQNPGDIEVIEHSAYQELQAENARFNELYQKASTVSIDEIAKLTYENHTLKAKLRVMTDARDDLLSELASARSWAKEFKAKAEKADALLEALQDIANHRAHATAGTEMKNIAKKALKAGGGE